MITFHLIKENGKHCAESGDLSFVSSGVHCCPITAEWGKNPNKTTSNSMIIICSMPACLSLCVSVCLSVYDSLILPPPLRRFPTAFPVCLSVCLCLSLSFCRSVSPVFSQTEHISLSAFPVCLFVCPPSPPRPLSPFFRLSLSPPSPPTPQIDPPLLSPSLKTASTKNFAGSTQHFSLSSNRSETSPAVSLPPHPPFFLPPPHPP